MRYMREQQKKMLSAVIFILLFFMSQTFLHETCCCIQSNLEMILKYFPSNESLEICLKTTVCRQKQCYLYLPVVKSYR